MGEAVDDDAITMEEEVDPATGESVFLVPDNVSEPIISNGMLVHADETTATMPDPPHVKLTPERFATKGLEDPWAAAEDQQNAGQEVRIVNGELVVGPTKDESTIAPESTNAVKLTDERFAALRGDEVSEIRRLFASGAASHFIHTLTPTSDMKNYFTSDPGGLYLHTKPSRFGDELHAVILSNPSTQLYQAHLWAFMKREDGELKSANLNNWIGTAPNMSAHGLHLYPSTGGHGAILCLSQRTQGGVTDISTCVMQAIKWTAGMGIVIRGGRFPYREG